MNAKQVIKIYKLTSAFPSTIGIDFLKKELEPILKEINSEMRISWACNSCVKNQMAQLYGWLLRQEETEKKVVKKKTVKKNVTKRTRKKGKS
mgnify:FL=1|jgi:hypothetical protein|tara:strand:- start:314 stop:589 length:276 start_codon:yes stop_codon:yes gene_type:complete